MYCSCVRVKWKNTHLKNADSFFRNSATANFISAAFPEQNKISSWYCKHKDFTKEVFPVLPIVSQYQYTVLSSGSCTIKFFISFCQSNNFLFFKGSFVDLILVNISPVLDSDFWQ